MPPQSSDNEISPLEYERESLYDPAGAPRSRFMDLERPAAPAFSHTWGEESLTPPPVRKRHLNIAGAFFIASIVFFVAAAAVAGYFLYFGGNTVSASNIVVDIQGPTTIAGGDTVPLLIVVTNKNSTAIDNATIEIDFPDGTKSAANTSEAYPRYVEDLGTIASGATVSRPVKAMLFGGAGQAVTLPVSLSYGTSGSSSTFVKKTSYALTIASTPLSLSVETPGEVTAGKPFTLTLTARSSASVPLSNVVVTAGFPFGFVVSTSSPALQSGVAFLLGTLQPGAVQTLTLTGIFPGQNSAQGTFHFAIGTAASAKDTALVTNYMTQEASVTTAAPFIATTLAINGNSSDAIVLQPGGFQNVTVSYANTLSESVGNVVVSVALSGSMIDYGSVKSTNGFYSSANHTVVFSRDMDSSLASLSPGAVGIGNFSFSTLGAGSASVSPTVTFTVSVSGTRAGQTSITGALNASVTKTAKVATAVAVSAAALHASGPLKESGPIPPRANEATTYTILWTAKNKGSAVAGGTMSATLPSYVTYTSVTTSDGFSYDPGSRTVSWNVGNLAQGASASGAFQVSITPSISQRGATPILVGPAVFSGYDRFAEVQVAAAADQVTTATPGDPGYVNANSVVQ